MTLLAFQLIILLFSVVIHEVSHGLVAERLGDPTARLAGRLTLNPIKHLDVFGSFLLPIFAYIASSGTFIFGYAKPVPYNPNNLKNPKAGAGIIAAAGPISNIAIASVFALLFRLAVGTALSPAILQLLSFIVLINIVLAVFNLVPIPPLDGSKILFYFLPHSFYNLQIFLERYGFFILLFFIFFGFPLITPIMFGIFQLLIGSSFLF